MICTVVYYFIRFCVFYLFLIFVVSEFSLLYFFQLTCRLTCLSVLYYQSRQFLFLNIHGMTGGLPIDEHKMTLILQNSTSYTTTIPAWSHFFSFHIFSANVPYNIPMLLAASLCYSDIISISMHQSTIYVFFFKPKQLFIVSLNNVLLREMIYTLWAASSRRETV